MTRLLSLLSVLALMVFAFATTAHAQTTYQLLSNVNVAFHGTGDMPGVSFGGEIVRPLKGRWSVSAGANASIHGTRDGIFYTDRNGETVDASIRYTTAGLQFGGSVAYRLIGNLNRGLHLDLGAFLRYQNSSLPNSRETFFQPLLGPPYSTHAFRNTEPQRTFVPGVFPRLKYVHAVGSHYLLGLQTGIQFDTNGDVLRHAGVLLGFRFRKP